MHTIKQSGERVYLDDFVKDIKSLKLKLQDYSYDNELSPPIDSEEAEYYSLRINI